MKIMAFNGSPRKKKWNTVTLLDNVVQGAGSVGAETELIQLYDLHFSGCISCFSCKKLSRTEDGVCAIRDDLSAALDRIKEADGLIIGTPVYYGSESAATRAFLERLCFPYLKYAKNGQSLFPRRIRTAMVYTMNVPEEMIQPMGYEWLFKRTKIMLEKHFGPCEVLLSTNTVQYSDYDQFEAEIFDKAAKYKRHAEVFPEDCKRAFGLGIRMATGNIPKADLMPR